MTLLKGRDTCVSSLGERTHDRSRGHQNVAWATKRDFHAVSAEYNGFMRRKSGWGPEYNGGER